MDALAMWRDLWTSQQAAPAEGVRAAQRAVELLGRGDIAGAERLLSDATGALEDADAPEAAAANHNRAVAAFHRGDLDAAVFFAVRAVFLYNRLSDLGGLCTSLQNLARLHAARGERRLATQAQLHAARARRELTARGMGDATGHDARGQTLLPLESAAPARQAMAR